MSMPNVNWKLGILREAMAQLPEAATIDEIKAKADELERDFLRGDGHE
jgi:hypothetical protein